MTEFTVIRAPEGKRLAKRIRSTAADGSGIASGEDLPYLCEFAPATAENVNELLDLLRHLRGQPEMCIIRGALREDAEQPCRRLTNADPKTGDAATLDAVPRDWVLLDFDSVPCPESIDFTREPARAALYLRNKLPSQFRDAGCVWRASSSAGIKPGIRLHLWFLLSTELDAPRLKHWLGSLPEGIKVDHKVFFAVQPHFTADPSFADGISDPMIGGRIGQLSGTDRVIVPTDIARYVPETVPTVPKSDGASGYKDPLLAAAVARWEEKNPPAETDHHARFTCPACDSADACAVLPDDSGKLFCHAAGHADRAPHVGSPANGGHVGQRIEFELGVSAKDLRTKLTELGYFIAPTLPSPSSRPAESANTLAAAAAAVMGDVVEGIIFDHSDSAKELGVYDSPAGRELIKASKELKAACTAIRQNGPGKLEALAMSCYRWVPRCLSEADITRELLAANRDAPMGASLTQPEAESILKRAAARGASVPHKAAARVSLELQCDDFGKPLSTQANVVTLSYAWRDLLALDLRLLRMVWRARPPWVPAPADGFWSERVVDDGDAPLACKHLADRHDYTSANVGQVKEAFKALARSGPHYDPIREYLDALSRSLSVDDAKLVCGEWLITFAGVEPSAYARAVSMRWLIGCVARVYEPGCVNREVLTLIGLQNKGKSSLFRELCPSSKFFKDDLSMKNEQTAKQGLLGSWIIELAEIDKLLRQDRHGELKSFISSAIDKFRMPYDTYESMVPRRVALCASSNEEQLLADTTGNSRYNVLRVGDGELDFEGVRACRDEIWAAACVLYEAGVQWWLQGEEKTWALAMQEKHRAIDDVEAWLRDLLETPHPLPQPIGVATEPRMGAPFPAEEGQLMPDRTYRWVTTTQLREAARVRGIRGADAKRISGALNRLGWVAAHRRVVEGGPTRRIFDHPDGTRLWSDSTAIESGDTA